jgi:hypothetical protein
MSSRFGNPNESGCLSSQRSAARTIVTPIDDAARASELVVGTLGYATNASSIELCVSVIEH